MKLVKEEVGVFLLGYSAHHNVFALSFLNDMVSQHESWRVHEASLPLVKEWLNGDCANVRRAVSEGLRVWTSSPNFRNNPPIAISLLSDHNEDESEYVRKSVGNALRDISQKYPKLILEELNSWN